MAIIAFGMVKGFYFEFVKYNQYKTQIAVLNTKIEDVQNKIEQIKNEEINTTEELEKKARSELNLVKPNEIVFVDDSSKQIDENKNTDINQDENIE